MNGKAIHIEEIFIDGLQFGIPWASRVLSELLPEIDIDWSGTQL